MNAFVAGIAVRSALLLGPGGAHRSPAPIARPTSAVAVVRMLSDGRSSGDSPPTMALLPDGRFHMGVPFSTVASLASSDLAHADRFAAITPDHEVAVESLFFDCFEVTNEQFKLWLDAQKRPPSRELVDLAWNFVDHGKRVEGMPPGAEKLPVRAITFDEAHDCARFLGKRLPTEAEWEYAARRGHPIANVYPWGGWNSWEAPHCASIQSSLRGATITTFVGGSFADDRSFDGLFDLCGNVAEWTDSPFLAYPGFEAPKFDDHGKKRVVAPDFTSGRKVVRGGSSWGNALTNNLVVRTPTAAGAAVADVGFRSALSSTVGLDALNAALEDLGHVLRTDRKRIELAPDAIAAQTIHFVDRDARLFERAHHVALARVRGAERSLGETRRTSIETPVIVGVVTLSEPATKPELLAGSYVVKFRTKGIPKSEQVGTPEKGRDGHGDHGGRGAPTGATPAPSGASSLRVDVEAPRDRDVLLFVDEQNHVAGWCAVQSRDTTPHASRLSIAERVADTGATNRTAAATAAMAASFSFTVKEPRGGAALELAFDLEFERGSFEPR